MPHEGSGRRAGETGLCSHALDRRRRVEFRRQSRHLVGGKRAEKALEDDLRFAQAGAEIVVQVIELRPAIGGLDRSSLGDIARGFVEFALDLLESIGKNAQLVEEAGAIAEQEMVENAVPGGRALARVAAEEFGIQRLDGRDARDQAAARRERIAQSDQSGRKTIEEIGSDGNLLAGANEFAACAQR